MKYQIVSSYPEVSGEEYDIVNKMLNWINESKIYNTDLDFGTDIEFVPTIPDDSAGTFLTPKESLPKAKPIKVPKTEGESTISFNDPKSFVESFYNIYINRGISPELAEVLSVQKLLESRRRDGNGFTVLAKEFNNFGGIKAGKSSTDYYTSETDEYMNGSKERITDKFRKFSSIDDYLDYESKYIYGDMGNFNGALSGDINHYFNTILGGRLKYATSPYYRDTLEDMRNRYFGVKNVKKGGILKAQRGVLVNNYNTPGDWYDYSGSSEIPKNGDHWGSRNPDTGLLLKHPNHETYYEMLKAEQRLGNRLFTDLNGREYSFNDFEAMTKGRMPGMKEKFYPSDLWSRDANKLYGSKLDTAVRYYNKLKALGAEDVQAAAIIGVLMKESSLDHHAVSSKGAKGVAQLLGDKYNDYTQWLSKNKKSDTAENQIEWVWDHMASGKDHWHDYYISLYNHSLNGFSDLYGKEKDTAIKDWSKMKDSKWAEYNYEAFRDDFYNMTDPGDAAELFTWTFERPGDDEADIDMRRRYSDSLYEYMTRFYKE